jgi:hypothetical protein
MRIELFSFWGVWARGSLVQTWDASWAYSAHWGYFPSGGLGLLLLVVIILIRIDIITLVQIRILSVQRKKAEHLVA